MFINYWFVIFSWIFFPIYWLCPFANFRKMWLLLACLLFHYRFAGPAGVVPIIIMGILTYFAGITGNRTFRTLTIVICVLELIFYKYTHFILLDIIGYFNADVAHELLTRANNTILPSAPPLAISFFVFEFVHYLVDLQKGKQPIYSSIDFTLFSIFWPSVVSGPIKRFEQFIPAIAAGCKKVSLLDIQVGIMRIVTGLIKKLVIADNLTAYIAYYQPDFIHLNNRRQWLIFISISLRILFDFSGYSDIAIGFARLMGIKLPENFNWPYLATSVQDCWRRWHISLSSWIRDYIYIPLGGNQYGMVRKVTNLVVAFAVCGLWHGAAWNFIIWGLYHGVGLAATTSIQAAFGGSALIQRVRYVVTPITWITTFMFVSIGWLYFFYPVPEATTMLVALFKR